MEHVKYTDQKPASIALTARTNVMSTIIGIWVLPIHTATVSRNRSLKTRAGSLTRQLREHRRRCIQVRFFIWHLWSLCSNLDIQCSCLSWSPILTQLFRPFVTGSDEPEQDHVASAAVLLFCKLLGAQPSFYIKWSWLFCDSKSVRISWKINVIHFMLSELTLVCSITVTRITFLAQELLRKDSEAHRV